MSSEMATDQDYRVWIGELKSKFRQAQLTAAIKVNSTLLAFYWELGADIVAKQQHSVWGEGFLTQLSQDLMTEFPEVKGFSKRNLEYIRRWHSFLAAILKQLRSKLFAQLSRFLGGTMSSSPAKAKLSKKPSTMSPTP